MALVVTDLDPSVLGLTNNDRVEMPFANLGLFDTAFSTLGVVSNLGLFDAAFSTFEVAPAFAEVVWAIATESTISASLVFIATYVWCSRSVVVFVNAASSFVDEVSAATTLEDRARDFLFRDLASVNCLELDGLWGFSIMAVDVKAGVGASIVSTDLNLSFSDEPSSTLDLVTDNSIVSLGGDEFDNTASLSCALGDWGEMIGQSIGPRPTTQIHSLAMEFRLPPQMALHQTPDDSASMAKKLRCNLDILISPNWPDGS